MRRHTRVQRGSSGNEAANFGIICAVDHAHILGHAVSVIPRRSEGVLRDHPSRRKYNKVGYSSSRLVGRAGKYCVNGRIGVVETDGVHAVEIAEVVLVRVVVAYGCKDKI
jgi:hypothetical protein